LTSQLGNKVQNRIQKSTKPERNKQIPMNTSTDTPAASDTRGTPANLPPPSFMVQQPKAQQETAEEGARRIGFELPVVKIKPQKEIVLTAENTYRDILPFIQRPMNWGDANIVAKAVTTNGNTEVRYRIFLLQFFGKTLYEVPKNCTFVNFLRRGKRKVRETSRVLKIREERRKQSFFAKIFSTLYTLLYVLLFPAFFILRLMGFYIKTPIRWIAVKGEIFPCNLTEKKPADFITSLVPKANVLPPETTTENTP